MRFAIVALSVCVALTGCAQYSEKAVAARLELADINADGIERANANLAAKVAAIDQAATFKADADTIDAVLAAIDSGMTTDTLRLNYFADVNKTRAALAAQRSDWQILIDEFNEAAANQRAQSAMTAEELRVAKRIQSLTGGK